MTSAKKRGIILISLLFLFSISFTYALEECQDIVSIAEVPCKVTNEKSLPNPCTTYQVDLYFDETFLYSPELQTSGIYCFWEFNETQAGDYYFNVSSGYYGKIKEVEKMYNLMVFGGYLLLILSLIVIIHTFQKDKQAIFIYGMFGAIASFIMTGILLSGFKVFSNLTFIIDVNYYLIGITSALGLYLFFVGFIFYKDEKLERDKESERVARGF